MYENVHIPVEHDLALSRGAWGARRGRGGGDRGGNGQRRGGRGGRGGGHDGGRRGDAATGSDVVRPVAELRGLVPVGSRRTVLCIGAAVPALVKAGTAVARAVKAVWLARAKRA